MKKFVAIVLLIVAASVSVAQTIVTQTTVTLTIVAQVNGMVCAFCAQGIEKKARALPQTQDVYVNLKQKLVAVQIKDGQSLSTNTVSDLIKDAGYDVAHIETVSETAATIRARLGHE